MIEPRWCGRGRGSGRERKAQIVKVSLPPQWVAWCPLLRGWAPHLLRHSHRNSGTSGRTIPPWIWMRMNWRIIILPLRLLEKDLNIAEAYEEEVVDEEDNE
jgi:hypothetical protein